MDQEELAAPIAQVQEGGDDLAEIGAPAAPGLTSHPTAVPHDETEEGLEPIVGGETEDEMLRRRKAETLPLLDPTPELDLLSPLPDPPSSSFDPLTSPFTSTTTTVETSAPPPLPLERLLSSTSTSTTSDEFGEFVNAPPSAAPDIHGGEPPATEVDPLRPGFVDPLSGSAPTSSLASNSGANPPPPLALDPLSLSSPFTALSPQPPPASSLSSLSSKQTLPPTPSTASAPPPPPPKSARLSHLVDEVLSHERGGLSLFANPAFHATGDEDEAPVPPPKPPSPLPPPPRSPLLSSRSPLLSSRAATPTPIAYQTGDLLSPTPVYAPTLTPPNTAANPGGAFRDHPLAPSPPGSVNGRTPPKVTTPHLPHGKIPSASSSRSNLVNNTGSKPTVEQTLKKAEGLGEETEIIAHHLGLIDHDYFSSREPADSSSLSIPIPPPGTLSRSRSRSGNGGGGIVGSLGGLLGGGSPNLSQGGSVSRGNTSPSVARAEGRAAPPVMSSGGEWDWGDVERERLGDGAGAVSRQARTDGDLSSDGVNRGRDRGVGGVDGDGRDRSSSPSQQRRSSSYGTVGGLWGLWKGAPPPPSSASASPEDHRPHLHHLHAHHGHAHSSATHHDHQQGQGRVYSTSPQPIGPTIVEDQPAQFSSPPREAPLNSASVSSSPDQRRTSNEYFDAQHHAGKGAFGTGMGVEGGIGVQGRTGRPLPKARMSLESIQARWMDHGGSAHSPSNSLSGSGSFIPGGLAVPHRTGSRSPTPSPSRSRKGIPIDPPTITHTSPFAPPPPPPNSAFFTSSSSLHAGFGDPMAGGLISSSAASSSSALGGYGGGMGSSLGSGRGNPFATHAFVPIAGAPGFRPEGYDWDKGFSEELERELERGGVVSPVNEEGVVTPRVTISPEPVDEKVNGNGNGGDGGRSNENGKEKVYLSGNMTPGARERERDALRDRGRQPRPNEGKHKEREPSIYQTIGSAFGLWGSSSSSASTSSSSAPRTPPLSSAKSAFGNHGAKEKDLGYNGHGRSATTPHFPSSTSGRGEGQNGSGRRERGKGDGKSGEGRRGEEIVGDRMNGRKVGELIEKKVGGLELVGRKESTVGVLGRVVGDKLRQHLPPLSRLPRTWTLLYSMDQHGISLNTLYTLCEAPLKNRRPSQPYVGMGGHILVIRDDAPASERDSCFGVYIADGLSRTKAKGFYGGGDSFLFKYHGATGTMEVFHPTGRNAYYALCDQGYVAFGGGGSSYAVWVGQDLLGGSSAGSVCFGNGGPACFGGVPKPGRKGEQGEGGEVEFEVVGLEVWGVGPT